MSKSKTFFKSRKTLYKDQANTIKSILGVDTYNLHKKLRDKKLSHVMDNQSFDLCKVSNQ